MINRKTYTPSIASLVAIRAAQECMFVLNEQCPDTKLYECFIGSRLVTHQELLTLTLHEAIADFLGRIEDNAKKGGFDGINVSELSEAITNAFAGGSLSPKGFDPTESLSYLAYRGLLKGILFRAFTRVLEDSGYERMNSLMAIIKVAFSRGDSL